MKTCEMYRISGEKLIALFYQEPGFGFFIVLKPCLNT